MVAMAVPAQPEDAPTARSAKYRLGGMGYQDVSGRRLSYASYLRIPDLLSLQVGRSRAHDELLFIVVHQAYELWFKLLLHELEAVRTSLDANDLSQARHYLHRIKVIEQLLIAQVEVLETMRPRDFLDFRSELAPASGFQSVQFREIEFLSGLKDRGYLKLVESAAERAVLESRLNARTLWDAYQDLLARRGVASPAEVYQDRDRHRDLFEISEGLLDHDEGFRQWRGRHILMVERQIGNKPGTGGSTGVAYLQSTLNKRFFPELWEIRSQL